MSTAPGKPNRVLATMLDRLLAGLISGPAMNCRPHASRHRVDLTAFAKLGDASPEQILQNLLGEDRQIRVLAKKKPPKKLEANPAEELSPQQRAWTEQSTLLSKLRLVADDARTYEQDTGLHVLNVGFPLLSLPPGSFGSETSTRRILAPIAFIPITIALKRGATPAIELACHNEGADRVQPNVALLAWLEQMTGKPQEESFTDPDGNETFKEIVELVQHVAAALNLPVPTEFSLPPAPPSASDATVADATKPAEPPVPPPLALIPALPSDDEESSAPAILCSAVLGLFPLANHGLLRDTQAMLAESADPTIAPIAGPLSAFLTADLDSKVPTAALEQTAPATAARSFSAERLASYADPCQRRAVSLARQSPALVIHGPPGTGKSQTITNIVVDHLGRGQRVLLVCDKRTALDVVANRLTHLGLDDLCGIVHDPQRDPRELYRRIREQLERLAEAKTNPQAEAELLKTDAQLQLLHQQLLEFHLALMASDPARPSFHELMGQWLSIQTAADFHLSESISAGLNMAELTAATPALLQVFQRSQSIDFPRNPWAKCVGISLADFLSRPMDAIRSAVSRCVADAHAADATLNPDIPPFAAQPPLHQQADARLELADALDALLPTVDTKLLQRWVPQDSNAIGIAAQQLAAAKPSADLLNQAVLDPQLLAALQPLPTPPQIAQDLHALEDYLQVADRWYAFLSLGTRRVAAAVCRRAGLPLSIPCARQLQTFLIGLRARLVVQNLRQQLLASAANQPLPADDVLKKFLDDHTAIFNLLLRLSDDDSLQSLAPQAKKILLDPAQSEAFTAGLRNSPPRASALTRLEETVQQSSLFDPKWFAEFFNRLLYNDTAAATFDALLARVDQLEPVLRTRQALDALSPFLHAAAEQLLHQRCTPDDNILVLRKATLATEIITRLRAAPQLQAMDAHAVESAFDRYRKLDKQKKILVTQSIRHQWIDRQKQRLLATGGQRLSALGADLRRRLITRGQRAMRLRQVISAGEKIEGGDPLFDLCPIWMASPQTVAQVFPRKALFDVVIFDEASQCRLEEALPVLTRAQRVVIAGDPQQLPPTRFFESAFTQSETDEPDTEQELFETQQASVEDLLGAALNLAVEQCYLDVHYRSRNSDLIAFSNDHFYNHRLQPIPEHPARRAQLPPVRLYCVNGIYNNRRNEEEADAVLEIVRQLLALENPPSIGIACFNMQQRDLLIEKLDDAAAEDEVFAAQLTASRTLQGAGSFQGLFVKNLENVQGDERDHIIISTTYGPDPRGKFFRRFGPLGSAGGGRRLNVLITRAREQVHLITSIPPQAYQRLPAIPADQVAAGAWLLFAYLAFAENLAKQYGPGTAGKTSAPQDSPLIHPAKTPSLFSATLAKQLPHPPVTASEVHWGNDGFRIDVALRHLTAAGEDWLGLLCDGTSYTAAQDPVEWDIFRTAVLADQGWKLQRIWTPHFFRDPAGITASIIRQLQPTAPTAAPPTANATSGQP